MSQTLAAVFNDSITAQQARDGLVDAGFPPDAIRLSTNSVASSGTPLPVDEQDTLMSELRTMLDRLFGDDRSRTDTYMTAIARGNCVLTVETASADFDRATAILDRFEPLNMDSDSFEWREASWAPPAQGARMGETAASMAYAPPAASDTRQSGGIDMGSRTGPQLADHLHIGGGLGWQTADFSEGNASRMGLATENQGLPMNETYETRLMWPRPGMHGKPAPQPGSDADDETYYRVHYEENYGSDDSEYGDYAHAYRYGKAMSRDQQYQGKDWDTAEPDLRSRWEKDYPSAWDQVVSAIRHGWHRITH